MKILLLYSIILSFLSSCATPLKNEGQGIRIVNDARLIQHCKYLSSVESSSSWGGFAATGVGYESAMNQLKNEAGASGANTILMSTLSNTMGGTNMAGEAYDCSAPPQYKSQNANPTLQM